MTALIQPSMFPDIDETAQKIVTDAAREAPRALTVQELAPWPATEADVSVDNILRHLLVWAKVYEGKLVDVARAGIRNPVTEASAERSSNVIAAYNHLAMSAALLYQLANTDRAVALSMAQTYWNATDDGEVFAEILSDALDRIAPTLEEAVVVAYDVATARLAVTDVQVKDGLL